MARGIQSSDYAKLLKAARQRARRLEAKGYEAPDFTGTREAAQSGNLRDAYNKLRKWMNREDSTIRGRRAKEAREAEARRKREEERERKRKAQEEARKRVKGAEMGGSDRPPKETADERRKRLHREAQRRYAERQRQKKGRMDEYLKGKSYHWRNLYSGLQKYGVKIDNPEELEAWMKYITERSNDSSRYLYEFDKWIDEVAAATGKDVRHITSDDIYNLLEGFQRWKEEQSRMEEEYLRERQANEYTEHEFTGRFGRFLEDWTI